MIDLSASPWLAELRSQWAGNSRLRWGLLVVVAIVWTQGLLMLGDAVPAWREQAVALRDEVDRVRPLLRDKAWVGRANDARQQLDALRSMQWQAADAGLAEAALQDWVRSSAGKAGLGIRELALVRTPAGPASAASSPASHTVRVRLVVDLNRLPLMAFLAELARNEQLVVVDRLVLRPASQPPQAELELRALAALRAEAR